MDESDKNPTKSMYCSLMSHIPFKGETTQVIHRIVFREYDHQIELIPFRGGQNAIF